MIKFLIVCAWLFKRKTFLLCSLVGIQFLEMISFKIKQADIRKETLAMHYAIRDSPEKNETDIFFYIPKMVAFRVKPPARDQKDWSIALK